MKTNITPPPWIVYESAPKLNHGFITVESPHAGVNIFTRQTYDSTHKEQLANAHLIANSPKILEALYNLYESCMTKGGGSPAAHDVYISALTQAGVIIEEMKGKLNG
jgi:hypothetical protein